MLRGQSAAGALEVQNTGTVDFEWSMSAQANGSDELIDVLDVGLYEGLTNDGAECAGPQIGSTQALSAKPTLATGRSIESGQSEGICVQVTVNPEAGISARFKIAEPTFHFVAEGA